MTSNNQNRIIPHNQPWYIIVETYHVDRQISEDNDEPEKAFVVNVNTKEGRAKLAKHCHWAMRNKRIVVTYAKDDVDENDLPDLVNAS